MAMTVLKFDVATPFLKEAFVAPTCSHTQNWKPSTGTLLYFKLMVISNSPLCSTTNWTFCVKGIKPFSNSLQLQVFYKNKKVHVKSKKRLINDAALFCNITTWPNWSYKSYLQATNKVPQGHIQSFYLHELCCVCWIKS